MANLTRDQRIIKENPGLTAYELLEKGLSQAGYEKLVSENYTVQQTPDMAQSSDLPKTEKPEPIRPTVQPTIRKAEPKLSSAPRQQADKHMGYLINKKTGKRTRMTMASIQFMMKLDKNSYNVG